MMQVKRYLIEGETKIDKKLQYHEGQLYMNKKIEKVTNSLCVVLEGCGNPDFRQYAPIAPTLIKSVETLQEASKVCQDYINEYDLGSGNWCNGKVYHPIKGVIASISYNGRIWKGDYTQGKQEEYSLNLITKSWKDL